MCVTLSDDDTRVYLWAFMNITTDNSGLPQYQQVFVSASIPSEFRLQIPRTGADQYGYLRPGSRLTPQWQERTYVVDLSVELSRQTAFSALRLTSANKIDIQASKATKGSADGFLVLPLAADSTEFYIASYDGLPVGHSSFLVVAPYRDTCVEASFVSGSRTRRIFFRSLKEFEVFQAYSSTEDYTGVHVKASGPIAVFGGHECAQVPVGKRFCDHVAEQMPPVSEWGTDHIAGAIIGRSWQAGYVLRVIAGFNGTTITCRDQDGAKLRDVATSQDVATADRGEFRQYEVADNRRSVHCRCSERCLVAQYNTGYQAYDPTKDVKTDPWMTIVTPVDHFTNYMTFSTLRYWAESSTEPFTNYLTIVARTAKTSGIRLNQQPLPSTVSWTRVSGTDYSTAAMALNPGNYSLYHVDDKETFVGYVYGHSVDVNPAGYGYATGYDIKGPPLTDKVWDELLTTATPAVCTNPRKMPSAADRGPSMYYTVSARLTNKATTAGCVSRYEAILNDKVDDLRALVNDLMCVGVLCPQTTDTFLTRLDLATSGRAGDSPSNMDSFDVEVEQATSLDENIGELIKCKKSVIAFLQEAHNWDVPRPVSGCPVLDLDDVRPGLSELKCDGGGR